MAGSRTTFATLGILLISVPLLAAAHVHTDAWAPRADARDQIVYLPSGDFLSVASFGLGPVLADLLWARTNLLFGENYGVSEDERWYSWIFHMVDLATDLDPEFRIAYKYGGTMLRVDNVFVDQSSLIFQKGMHALPEQWYFPYSIAMNYYTAKDNKEVAARYMRHAAELDGAPFYLRNLAITMAAGSQSSAVSLEMLRSDYDSLPAGLVRDSVEGKIGVYVYLVERDKAQEVVESYRREHGRYPEQPMDVVAAGYKLPVVPAGRGERWVWSSDPSEPWGTVAADRYGPWLMEHSKRFGLGSNALGTYSAEPAGPALEPDEAGTGEQ